MSYHPDQVAAVLQQLKQEVRSQRLREQADQSATMATALAQVRLTRWVNPHQPIAWPHWPPGIWPKIVAAGQKIVRYLLRWYINPIIEEQNQFNAAVEAALTALARENAQLRAELRLLKADQFNSANSLSESSKESAERQQ
jgi:hypothetical protein